MGRPKDETYVIDLCDSVLRARASRGPRFDFLRGDPGIRGQAAYLPVDAYYADYGLVVEYHERQHTESVALFDRRATVSGVGRGEQRKLYEQRRRDLLPANGLSLLEIHYSEFECDRAKRLLRKGGDVEVVRQLLLPFMSRHCWVE